MKQFVFQQLGKYHVSTTRIAPVRRHTTRPHTTTSTTISPTFPIEETDDFDDNDYFTSTTEAGHWWQIFKQPIDTEQLISIDDSTVIRRKQQLSRSPMISIVKRSIDNDNNHNKITHSDKNTFRKSVHKNNIRSSF